MNIRKLRYHEDASACVHEYRKDYGDLANRDVLVSYTTAVLAIDYDSYIVICNGLYSRTTIKHISWFMREKGMDYYIARKCFKENCMYNFAEKKFIPRPA